MLIEPDGKTGWERAGRPRGSISDGACSPSASSGAKNGKELCRSGVDGSGGGEAEGGKAEGRREVVPDGFGEMLSLAEDRNVAKVRPSVSDSDATGG